MSTPLPITEESFWKIQSVDPSGRAWALYCFYARVALMQNSSQPLATDQFCKNGLKWGSLNTVQKARKFLMTAGAIEHFAKQSYHYVRLNYLTVELQNRRFELSEKPIPPAVMGTANVFDYYARWWDRLTNGCLDEFAKRLKKKLNASEKPDFDAMVYHMNVVYDRINRNAKCITTMDTELRFWGHLLDSVAREFQKERTKMKAA